MGRIVMISGGARGLGAAITARCLADGHRVSVGLRQPEKLAQAFPDADPDQLQAHRFDADAPETAQAWVDATVAQMGAPDALINNAGILKMVDFTRGTEADLDDLWTVNVKAPFRLIRAALPHLKASGRGRVVSIASTDAKRYRDPSASLGYVMTKGALLSMTQAVRFQGWDEGLRGTAICPGAIDTEMIADIPGVTPKDKRLQPDDVAEIVSLVLSLPNQASLPEIVVNTRLEPFI
ncbi:SDR family NAD(P)-dependent oxidoreductase [Mameliella sediminis]|uniref:SDR family NAD(P)-dependent oxidoreductase n=1 Tax=Mameliella sediminis TaxID=2836866 RepID=UPI001C476C87|nr:SDR family NAD(P)-dependent oxidoreductase [Mameliella sediminis]MBY6146924.1 SDR family NAD(P)-dependent oxidoreductase [Mameliella alba]MBV7397299.1 SDR family NAD(P)-dependent oxidoreductase [Mameliella sediminis]MBY6163806.1 SDR family NAD(P)-dependent oxidoreductase [Mameliella alba]MBY6172217.1 SDR family NAD(P)-dependent oxidoreductase [Mameliella alba]MBY6177293.1 SDR family NAD(P)-dependent oxidoreductase [Mameliella alba]